MSMGNTGDHYSTGEITTMAATPGGGAVNAGGIRGRGGGVFDGDSADDDDDGDGDDDDDDDDSESKEIHHGPPGRPRFPIEIDRRRRRRRKRWRSEVCTLQSSSTPSPLLLQHIVYFYTASDTRIFITRPTRTVGQTVRTSLATIAFATSTTGQ